MATTIPDQLARMDEAAIAGLEGRYEFIDGVHVEKPLMGALANFLAMVLLTRLWAFVQANRLGLCFAENCAYRIFADDPNRKRIPDGSFIRSGRPPGNKPPLGDITIAPDLAIEVVSPNDGVENLQVRINDFLTAGVRLVWVIVPATRQVFNHRGDGTLSKRGENGDLSGEDVVPGFTCRLAELFDAI